MSDPRSGRVGPYVVQFLANTALVIAVVYLPLFARDIGAGKAEIGLMVGLYQAMLLVSGIVFGRWADFGDRKLFVVLGCVASVGALAVLVPARTVGALYAMRAAGGIAAGVFPAALMAYFYQYSAKLGRFSGFSALGWAVGAMLVGVIPPSWLFWVAAAIMGAAALVAQFALGHQHVRLNQPIVDGRVLRRNWKEYAVFFLRHAGATSIWAIYPLFLSDLGASRFWVGVIYALNPLAQVVFLNFFERFGERSLMLAGAALSVLVFVGFGLSRNWVQVLPIQVLLAVSWSALYLGELKRLMRRNVERSTAAGMLQSVLSLSAVCGAFLVGVTGRHGYGVVMFAAAGLALAGLVLYLVVPEPAD
jgi:MFS family permease